MPWTAIGAGLTAIGGLATGLFNNKSDKKLFNKQAAFAREESQKERDWQERMYNQNNAYNSPAAQMQRYKDAGLNPDLVYGDGSLTSPAQAPSGGAQAPTPTAGHTPFQNPFADAGSIISQKKLIESQAKANDAKANRDNKEVEIASARLVMDKAKSESAIRLENSQVYLNHVVADYTHKQGERVAAEINNLNASTSRLQQETENLRKELEVQDERISTLRFERFIRSAEFKQSVRESNSRIADNYASAGLKKQQKRTEVYRTTENMYKAGLNEQEWKVAVATYVEQVAGIKARSATDEKVLEKVKKQLGILDIEAAEAQFNFDKNKEYKDLMIIMGLANEFVNTCADAASAYKSFGAARILKNLGKGRGSQPSAPAPTTQPSTPFN